MAGARRITIQFLGEDKSLGKTAQAVEQKTSGIGSKLKKVGAVAATGLAVAGAAALKFGADTIQSASNAQQSLGATQTVFGKFSSQVVKDSNAAANAVGLSANEYRESANLIGSLFKNQGVATDELAGKTKQMVGLGADLAATFGGTTKESVEALGSAFKGEYDPLERYGISLKESTVNAELAKRGQDKLTGAALAQAKQMAVTDLIMRQSKDSLGAFGRESNTLAGQQQRLSAKFENLKATLGQKLLPVATKVVGWLSKFIDQMGKGQGAGGKFASIMAAVGKVLKAVGGFIGKQVVPFVKQLFDRMRDAAGGTQGMSDKMKDLRPFIEVVKAALKGLWTGLKWAANTLLPLLVKWWGVLAKGLGAVGRMATWLWNKAFAPALRFIVRGVANLMDMWAGMLRALGKIPGFGWAKEAANRMSGAAREARGLEKSIKDIPRKWDVVIKTTYKTSRQMATGGNPLAPKMAARGGVLKRGQLSWVGERGPELFRAPSSGSIISNAASRRVAPRSGGDQAVVININGALDPNAVAKQIQDLLLKLKRRRGGGDLGLA